MPYIFMTALAYLNGLNGFGLGEIAKRCSFNEYFYYMIKLLVLSIA